MREYEVQANVTDNTVYIIEVHRSDRDEIVLRTILIKLTKRQACHMVYDLTRSQKAIKE